MHMGRPPDKITLALSGGGFRATLFHLGVIKLLQATEMLERVKAITAVSGGSIMATHLVHNWEKYVDDASFNDAAKVFMSCVKRCARSCSAKMATWNTNDYSATIAAQAPLDTFPIFLFLSIRGYSWAHD